MLKTHKSRGDALEIFHVPQKCPLEKFSTIRKMGKTDSGKTVLFSRTVGKW